MVAVALASQREAPPRSCLSPTSISVLACWRPNVLGVSCTAGPARESQSGAPLAANELRAASGDLQAAGRRLAGDEVGSSAAGPKPGRASFTPKLGAAAAAGRYRQLMNG